MFGTLAGLRHAFEPDHLAAVSTLVTDRPGSWRAAKLGAWWGLGHTTALAVVGLLLALLDRTLPPQVEQAFEFAVALMLLFLGGRAVARSLFWFEEDAPATHGWLRLHQHSGLQAHLHVGDRTYVMRPLLVGIVHGLAGSGALTALVMSTLPDTPMRLAYTVLFGLASTAGMATVSGLAGFSLARITSSSRTLSLMSVVTGVLSIAVGGVWGYPILRQWLTAL